MPPDLPSMLLRADAALLIGDPALRLSLATESGTRRGEAGEQICSAASAGITDDSTLHIYDVVEQWRRMTTLPAVLAVWAARRKVATVDVIADFQASRDFGLRRLSEISTQAAADLNLPANKLQRYLTGKHKFHPRRRKPPRPDHLFRGGRRPEPDPPSQAHRPSHPRPERQRDTDAAYAKPR